FSRVFESELDAFVAATPASPLRVLLVGNGDAGVAATGFVEKSILPSTRFLRLGLQDFHDIDPANVAQGLRLAFVAGPDRYFDFGTVYATASAEDVGDVHRLTHEGRRRLGFIRFIRLVAVARGRVFIDVRPHYRKTRIRRRHDLEPAGLG